MAMWPFGRRRRRARPSGPQPVAQPDNPPADVAAAVRPRASRKLSKRGSIGRKTSPPNGKALEKHTAEGATNPMDITKSSRRHPSAGSREDITALPISKELRTSPHLRPVTQETEGGIPYNFHSAHSGTGIPASRGKLQRTPSRNKRAALESPLPRKKPSKKRKDDHVREEEIRAMSAPIAIPKQKGSGDLLRRDSRKFRGGLNKNFERPTSNISLPMEASITSSGSAHSDSRNYRVSLLDVVAPRPALRYSLNTPYVSTGMSSNNWNTASRTESKRPYSEKEAVSSSDKRTIDALADDLSAGELREILERDTRRRERKRKADAERLQRKLERRAEKERKKQLQAQEQGVDDSKEKGKEPERPAVTGLGIETQAQGPAPDTPTKPPIPVKSQERLRRANLEPNQQVESKARPESTAPRRDTISSAELSRPDSPSRDTVPSQPSSFPQTSLSEPTPPSTAPQRDAEPAAKKAGRWSSIFRRDARRKSSSDRGKVAPAAESSFTNISRDSMSHQAPPAHLHQPPPVITTVTGSPQPRRQSTPIRTQSKFREELPEMPLSPPDSRVQSPEATKDAPTAIAARRGNKIAPVQTNKRVSTPIEEPVSQGPTESPISTRGSHLMSQSLASIDSEGSWLSGKAMNRLSSTARKYHSGASSSAGRPVDDLSGSHEELGIHDDEYFQRLTPQPGEVRRSSGLSASVTGHTASSNAMAGEDDAGLDTDEEMQSSPPRGRSSGDVDAHTVVHSSVGRQPTVVHRDVRVKSSEGLLKQYNEASGAAVYNTPPASPKKTDAAVGDGDDDVQIEDATHVQRASSVKVGGGHARQISAGSAKLLDIPKRASQSSSRATSMGPADALPTESKL